MQLRSVDAHKALYYTAIYVAEEPAEEDMAIQVKSQFGRTVPYSWLQEPISYPVKLKPKENVRMAVMFIFYILYSISTKRVYFFFEKLLQRLILGPYIKWL